MVYFSFNKITAKQIIMDEKVKQEITLYLTEKKPDPRKGAELYFKYGKSSSLRRVFTNSPGRYLSKMRWELAKLIGVTLHNFQKGIFETEGVSVSKPKYPPVIERIKADLPVMYKQRVQLQKELTELTQTNAVDEKEKAAQLAEIIHELAERYQLLHDAKELYFNEGIVPDEKELYPEDEKNKDLADIDPVKLLKEKKNLESSLTKDRNKLLYQSIKKLDEENPMPKGEARTKLEARIKTKEERLKAINEYLTSREAD